MGSFTKLKDVVGIKVLPESDPTAEATYCLECSDGIEDWEWRNLDIDWAFVYRDEAKENGYLCQECGKGLVEQ